MALVLVAVVVSTAAVASLLALAGVPIVPGWEDPRLGAVLRATFRGVSVVGACGTVGALVFALVVVGVPRTGPAPPDVRRLVVAASRWSALWFLGTLHPVLLLLDEAFADVGTVEASGRSVVVAAWGAGVVAVTARGVVDRRQAVIVLGLAAGTLLAAVSVGHSWHAELRAVALASMAVHVVAASAWVGGLIVLSIHTGPHLRQDVVVLRRYSRLALACFVGVAASGAVNAVSRLSVAEVLDSGPYGSILAVKVAALVVLGWCGLLHRRRALPRLAGGDPSLFWVLVAGELVVLTMAVGFGVALAGTGH